MLQRKETSQVRFLMRQDKTRKIVADHYVDGGSDYCKFIPSLGSERCWVWAAQGSAEEEVLTEHFVLKFGDIELAQQFQMALDGAKISNSYP